MLIETNIEVNLRSIEEFTRVMVSELLEDKINFEILKEDNFIKINVKSEKLNKNTEFSYIDLYALYLKALTPFLQQFP